VRSTGRVELQLANARALPFHDRSFDLVIVGYIFDLLPETDFGLVIAEIHRVLRDSGRVVVDMTIAERRRDDVHRWVSRLRPRLLGGCRGVRLAACLASGGFEVEHRVGGEYSSGQADLRFCRSSVVLEASLGELRDPPVSTSGRRPRSRSCRRSHRSGVAMR
jgi:SAM-dependent methyltransferase